MCEAGKQNNMIGGTDKAHSYARMPCTRADGDVCAIRSRPVPPIKYFCLFSSSSSFPFVCAKVDQLVPKVWHKSKITEKRRVLRLVPESGTSHDHVGTGAIGNHHNQKVCFCPKWDKKNTGTKSNKKSQQKNILSIDSKQAPNEDAIYQKI